MKCKSDSHKPINETNKQKLIDVDTDNDIEVTRGKGGWEEVKRVKGIKYLVTEEDLNLGSEHTTQYTVMYYRVAHLKHIILLTNVTLMHLIQ